jgi:hypothetical protein
MRLWLPSKWWGPGDVYGFEGPHFLDWTVSPAGSRVGTCPVGRSTEFAVEYDDAGSGASGDLLRDERGMLSCLSGKRPGSARDGGRGSRRCRRQLTNCFERAIVCLRCYFRSVVSPVACAVELFASRLTAS